MPHDVFISYSQGDKLAAEAACATFERLGIRCWMAPRDIAPGAEWGEAIIDAIDACPVMVLIFSAHANESRQVRRELERAVFTDTTIMPVRLEEVEPTRSLAYYVAGVHWLDALTPPLEQHLERLAGAIRSVLAHTAGDSPPAPPPTTTAAPATTTGAPLPPTTAAPATTVAPTTTQPAPPGIEAARALMARAEPLMTLGRHKEAVGILAQLIGGFRENPDQAVRDLLMEACFRLAEAQDEGGNKETALATLDVGVSDNLTGLSEAGRYWLLRCWGYYSGLLGQMDEPQKSLDSIAAGMAWARDLPENDKSLPTLVMMAANSASQYLALRRYPEAINAADLVMARYGIYQRVPGVSQGLGRVRYVKARALDQSHRVKEALVAYGQAIEALGDVPGATALDLRTASLLHRGAKLHGLKRPREALADFEQLRLALGPNLTDVNLRHRRAMGLYNAGLCYEMLKRKADAVAMFDQVIEENRDPTDQTMIDLAAKAINSAKPLRGG